MTESNKVFTEKEFKNLCEFVCEQMTPSSSKVIDREALYFAIYWQLCEITEQSLFTTCVAESKISDYREKIRKILSKGTGEYFDASEIADRVICSYIDEERGQQISKAKNGQICPFFAFDGHTFISVLKNSVK